MTRFKCKNKKTNCQWRDYHDDPSYKKRKRIDEIIEDIIDDSINGDVPVGSEPCRCADELRLCIEDCEGDPVCEYFCGFARELCIERYGC